jgi:hypothetical protein
LNAPLFVLMTLVAAAGIALVIFLGGLLLVPARAALRLAGSALIGAAIGFAATALAMAPFHPQAYSEGAAALSYFGPALLAGLAGGLLCAVMIYRISRRQREST